MIKILSRNCIAIIYAILFTTMAFKSVCQPKQYVSFPTPNAASFGVFGQIPVNYFNGIPDISIPLYTLQEYGITMPISLAYHAGGVHPDFHPGWVGLGWNLTAGGVITRIANGPADEIIANPSATANTNSESYYYNHTALSDDATWNSLSNLTTVLANNNQVQPSTIPAPDEFTFNFNGYSGSFFLDHTGHWKVRSANGKAIKISENLNTVPFNLSSSPLTGNTPAHGTIPLTRIFYSFDLTTPDGVVYTFGGTDNAIEFSRSPGEHDVTYRQVTATSWYLTKIKTLTGDEITLNYERDGYTIVGTESWNSYYVSSAGGYTINSSQGPGNYAAATLLNPVYLKEIVTPNQTLAFTRSLTSELRDHQADNWKLFNEGQATTANGAGSNDYADIGTEGSSWFKLTKMTVTSNFDQQTIKGYKFQYKDISTSRLMLLSVQETDANDQNKGNPYEFTYEDDPNFDLPDYLSRKLDHWGFFNNRSYFEEQAALDPNRLYGPADEAAYTQSRNPDAYYLKEGTLNKIHYPTGGNTTFEYEANDYSYVIHTYDTTPAFDVVELGVQGQKFVAGGLRIKKITSTDNISPPIVKEYVYNDDHAAPKSSGILSGLPVYVLRLYPQGSLNCSGLNGLLCVSNTTPAYWYFYNRSILPMSFTAGSHVTYTTVKELLSDGSFNIYRYTNHNDPLYRDGPVDAGAYAVFANTSNIPVTDMSYTRGKMLSEEAFSAAGKLLKKVTYQYNSKPERFNEFIRTAPVYTDQINGQQPAKQAYVYKKYLFEPYVTKITTDTYNQLGTDYVTSVKDMEYDDQTLLLKKQSTLQSDGSTQSETYKYPGNKAALSSSFSTADLQVVDLMISKNVVNPLLETDTYNGTAFLKRASTTYKQWSFNNNNFYRPDFDKFRLAQGTQDEISVNYERYDEHGNLLSVISNGGNRTSFKWGYNGQFPILKITNAGTGDYFSEDFENETSISPGLAHTGVKSYNGVYTHNFTPTLAKPYILSYWQFVSGKWQLQSQPYTTTTITINAGVPIDDIMVRPQDALPTTYTYRPQVGVTSLIAPSGLTTYYAYDAAGRLQNVKDQDANIIKDYNYHYTITVANWQVTGTTRCQMAQRLWGIEPTGFTEHEEKDLNPNSRTYNSSRWVQDAEAHAQCPPTYSLGGTHGPYFDGIYVTATKSYDEGLRTRYTYRVTYDDMNGQYHEIYQDIVLNYGETEKTDFVQVQAYTYLEADLISYTHF